MSYRKNHGKIKSQEETQKIQPILEFANPGVEKAIYTGRLTSGQPYQRHINVKEVERLIREWSDGKLQGLQRPFL